VITTFNLQWDAGSNGGTWYNLLGATTDSLDTDYTVLTGITPGATYQFQVRAKNIWGYGDFSSLLYVEASDVPEAPAIVTTYVDSATGNVVLDWLEPDDNSSPIFEYLIEIEDQAQTIWQSYTTSCNGALASIVTARQCTFAMSVFTDPPYSYTLGNVIAFRVSAQNANGWGDTSTPNTAGAEGKTIPATMNAPTRGSGTSESQIVVDWDTLTLDADTGGSDILSYNLQWYTTTWEDLVGYPSDSLLTSFTITSGLTAGTSYDFRVRALNIYGWSTVSATVTIDTSTVPDKMDPPVITENLLKAKIEWDAPNDNSDAITGYEIYILHSDGVTWSQDMTDCDGMTILVAQEYCEVPMTTLVSTYGYSRGELVIAKVRAKNDIGFGDYSEQNSDPTGGKVQTIPGTMYNPQFSTSTLTSITVFVDDPLLDDVVTGGATIDSIHF